MRVRSNMVVAAMLAAAATSFAVARVASAQGSHASDRIFTPPPVTMVETRPPAVLDDGWVRALHAVLDEMKHRIEAEWIEVGEIDGPIAGPTEAGVTPPPVPAWRAAWSPAIALREQVAASPVQVTPIPVEPPTETPVDTRGQHAVLLGVKMELPWMVP